MTAAAYFNSLIEKLEARCEGAGNERWRATNEQIIDLICRYDDGRGCRSYAVSLHEADRDFHVIGTYAYCVKLFLASEFGSRAEKHELIASIGDLVLVNDVVA